MPAALPAEAITLHGGCGCRAIRYTLAIPAYAERPLFCAADSNGDEVRYPLMLVDHCNDCRRATGGIVNAWSMCPTEYMEFSLLLRDQNGDEKRVVIPAAAVIKPGQATAGTYMQHYQSPIKEPVMRMFCGRCGTNAWYAYSPLPEGFVPSMDVLIGTLDREDLETVRFDRHVWWDYGIDWVQRWVTAGDATILNKDGGQHLLRHPIIYMHESAQGYANDP